MTIGKRALLVTVTAVLMTGSFGSASAVADQRPREVVRTESGPVRGIATESYRSFHGIPFAAPPVGDLRWRSPQQPRPWTGTRDATKPAPACAQGSGGGQTNTSEDCLYLNVTTPNSATPGRSKPVMVWLHGGGNSYGTASAVDPHRLAVGGDVVVVTANYRLGVFGNLNHPALDGSGAYGLEDQQAALRWVRRNITGFGGDPRKVTLLGQSGGAFDVCAQLTSPSAAGLFHRAILQSSTCSTAWERHLISPGQPAGGPWHSRKQAHKKGLDLAAERGCPDPGTAARCLRALKPNELQPPETGAVLTAVAYGNRILPGRPDRAVAAGRFHTMPIMSGRTRDEGRFGVLFPPEIAEMDEATYQSLLGEAFGDRAGSVAAKYPAKSHDSPALAFASVSTDRIYSCPHLRDEQAFSRRVPVYAYEFADRQAPPPFGITWPIPTGAYHTAELLYLFDSPAGRATLNAKQQLLAKQMITYWAQFARTGNPNSAQLPEWPRARHAVVQSLAPGSDGIRPVTLTDEHPCGFWAGLSQHKGHDK
jgi:para-nitrobenzyl esterase